MRGREKREWGSAGEVCGQKVVAGFVGSRRSWGEMMTMANGEDEEVPFMGRQIKVQRRNLIAFHGLWGCVQKRTRKGRESGKRTKRGSG